MEGGGIGPGKVPCPVGANSFAHLHHSGGMAGVGECREKGTLFKVLIILSHSFFYINFFIIFIVTLLFIIGLTNAVLYQVVEQVPDTSRTGSFATVARIGRQKLNEPD